MLYQGYQRKTSSKWYNSWIHELSGHLMETSLQSSKVMHCSKISMEQHLGVHVRDLDPVKPPGDHCGGVGAIGGAGHRVGLVCREWLLGTKWSVRDIRH